MQLREESQASSIAIWVALKNLGSLECKKENRIVALVLVRISVREGRV